MKHRQSWLRLLPLACLLILAATSAVPPPAAAQPESVDIGPTYTEGTAPLDVTFYTSAYHMQGYLTYNWSFGDDGWYVGNGRYGTGSAVSHTYTVPGYYQVSLGACTDWGECGYASAYVIVHEP